MHAIIYQGDGKRSHEVCTAWRAGLINRGISHRVKSVNGWGGGIEADIAIFYGLKDKLRKIQRTYSKCKDAHAVFIDLGYWGRTEGGQLEGYHRIAVDSLHASDYFQNIKHGTDRVQRFNITPCPMKKNEEGHILLCGQSEKAAWVFGLAPEEWEQNAIATLKGYTSRQIIYRPKPSWPGAGPIDGTTYSPPEQELEEVLDSAWAVVTHHSNVGIDALVKGIPSFTLEGLAKPLSKMGLKDIEHPLYPSSEIRQQLFNDVAYTQWSMPEIRSGLAWDYLIKEVF